MKTRKLWTVLISDDYRGGRKTLTHFLRLLRRDAALKKLSGHLRLGTGDPSDTARLFEALALIGPVLGDGVELEADMENWTFRGAVRAEGRIHMRILIPALMTLLRDSDFRKMITALNGISDSGEE